MSAERGMSAEREAEWRAIAAERRRLTAELSALEQRAALLAAEDDAVGGDADPMAGRRGRDQQAIEMWRAGATAREIGSELGLSTVQANNLVTRLRNQGVDLPLRRPPVRGSGVDHVILGLWRTGATARDVGQQVGLTASAVSASIKRMRARGVDIPYRHDESYRSPRETQSDALMVRSLRHNAHDPRLLTMWARVAVAEGMAITEIARHAGVAPDTISRLLGGGPDSDPPGMHQHA